MTIEQETVERLAVENETLAQELRRLGGDDADAAVATAGWNEWVATVLRALLAERDAALAEVARLSTPPDNAEVAGLVGALGVKSAMIQLGEKIAWGSDTALMDKAADFITRLSHALALLTQEGR